ncbi:MAG: ferritin family protein [Candidatus Muiribacteriaceae bacterium]
MKYNAFEIIEMAKRMEDNAAFFYRTAADRVKDPDAKRLLEELAEMEDVHKMVFNDYKSFFSEEEWSNMNYDSDGDMFHYLEEMADSIVFDLKRSDEEMSGLDDVDSIFRFAIDKEKQSVLYYTGIRELVPEALGKDKITEIIREEMKHVAILSDARAKFGK